MSKPDQKAAQQVFNIAWNSGAAISVDFAQSVLEALNIDVLSLQKRLKMF